MNELTASVTTDTIINTDVICPHCQMPLPLSYNPSIDQRPFFIKCKFCDAQMRWTETSCDLVPPIGQVFYLIVNMS